MDVLTRRGIVWRIIWTSLSGLCDPEFSAETNMNLFQNIPPADEPIDKTRPLADRMRPRTLDEFVGQEHILGPGKALRVQIERDDTGSLIFWGPPGVGKTTLAKIIARMTHADFVEFSAVMTGIKEIKQVGRRCSQERPGNMAR